MRTFVYVDGFNLYYGCLKRSNAKWLNIHRLCELLLPKANIERIKYFTARVKARPHDPQQPARQDTYFRAPRTLPNIEIFEGHFLSHPVRMPACDASGVLTGKIEQVLKTEEKGSDVNLASHLLFDAFSNRFEQAVITSNDSDLLTPVHMVQRHLKKRVGFLNPHKKASVALSREAAFVRRIRYGALRASQFPSAMRDAVGQFSKPSTW